MACWFSFSPAAITMETQINERTLRKISRDKNKEFHSSFTTTWKRPCHSFLELSMTKKVFAKWILCFWHVVVVSLACVISESYNLHTFFCCCWGHKRGSLCQAFLAETMETATKNCCMMEGMHWCLAKKKNLGKIEFRAFLKCVSPQLILSLESNDYFGTSEHHWVVKKRRILISKTAMVGCCELLLYANGSCDEHVVYFWRWLKWRAM